MNKIFANRKLKWQTWSGILILLAFSAAFSLTVWVFSLYTLLHWQKVLVFGYLFITLGLFLLRYVQPELEKVRFKQKELLGFVLGALSVLFALFNLVDYHKAPIRTVHELTLTNISEKRDITLDYIQLPGDARVDLMAEYPDYDFYGESVILHPGQSLSYSREMVGGIEISVSADYYGDGGTPNLRMVWDGDEEEPDVYQRGTNYTKIELPGWRWGTPSIFYRALGILNIAADSLAIFGLVFCLEGIFSKHKALIDSDTEFPAFETIKAFSLPILINIGLMILAGINQLWISKNTTYSLILILVGLIIYITFFLAQHRKWVIPAAFVLIIFGIIFNIYFFINPYNVVHLTLKAHPDDSLSTLAFKAGSSTHLSLGYYQFFRNANLHIPADVMGELNLYSDRLEKMNIGMRVIDDSYEYELDKNIADQLLEDYGWQAWPREEGGTFYLSMDHTNPGDDLFFFESGLQYFLISENFLTETGIIDVSILN